MFVTQNYPFCRLQLVFETFKHSNNQSKFKVDPKVVKETNKKTLSKNFGDQRNKQPNVPSLPGLGTTKMQFIDNYDGFIGIPIYY